MGTFDHGENPFNSQDVFTLVSCSDMVPVKRLHLIVEILMRLDFTLEWIHFGEGELSTELTAESKRVPQYISVQFKGYVENQEIMGFYRSHPVNLFINVSESEGLPVSMMEAISFGIPVLATDVGGVSEIVNEETGILVPKDFDPATVADTIDQFRKDKKNTPEFRNQVRKYWMEHFYAEKNYEDFSKHLLQ